MQADAMQHTALMRIREEKVVSLFDSTYKQEESPTPDESTSSSGPSETQALRALVSPPPTASGNGAVASRSANDGAFSRETLLMTLGLGWPALEGNRNPRQVEGLLAALKKNVSSFDVTELESLIRAASRAGEEFSSLKTIALEQCVKNLGKISPETLADLVCSPLGLEPSATPFIKTIGEAALASSSELSMGETLRVVQRLASLKELSQTALQSLADDLVARIKTTPISELMPQVEAALKYGATTADGLMNEISRFLPTDSPVLADRLALIYLSHLKETTEKSRSFNQTKTACRSLARALEDGSIAPSSRELLALVTALEALPFRDPFVMNEVGKLFTKEAAANVDLKTVPRLLASLGELGGRFSPFLTALAKRLPQEMAKLKEESLCDIAAGLFSLNFPSPAIASVFASYLEDGGLACAQSKTVSTMLSYIALTQPSLITKDVFNERCLQFMEPGLDQRRCYQALIQAGQISGLEPWSDVFEGRSSCPLYSHEQEVRDILVEMLEERGVEVQREELSYANGDASGQAAVLVNRLLRGFAVDIEVQTDSGTYVVEIDGKRYHKLFTQGGESLPFGKDTLRDRVLGKCDIPVFRVQMDDLCSRREISRQKCREALSDIVDKLVAATMAPDQELLFA